MNETVPPGHRPLYRTMLRLRRAFTLGLVVATAQVSVAASQSAAPAEQDIVAALRVSRTRSIVAPAANAADQALLDALSKQATRGISVEDRKSIAEMAKRRPAIDMEVPFDLNSAAINPNAAAVLGALGRALTHPDLKGGKFLLAGHTDAKGAAEYNLQLSVRRAKAVRDFLIAAFKIEPDRLIPVGFGLEQLKRADLPLAAENRRVQIVNVARE